MADSSSALLRALFQLAKHRGNHQTEFLNDSGLSNVIVADRSWENKQRSFGSCGQREASADRRFERILSAAIPPRVRARR
jgi:hypothetical protein